MKTLQIYNGTPGTGPNPWKVIIILIDLSLPYQIVWIPYKEITSEPYTTLNPNGRFPAFIDPNTDVTLFESGAVIEYLVTTYDTGLKLTYGDNQLQDKWLLRSWLMFQMSGQGPMFGQKMWFTHFHVEPNVTSAIQRYGDETRRIVGVIERQLGKQREKRGLGPEEEIWLVGEKCTYADLAFVTWDLLLEGRIFPRGEFDAEKEFPEFYKWHQNLLRRPAVSEAVRMREEAMRTMENSAAAVLPKRSE
ncbi:glutathione S-transferase [Pseudomassariella vexata]|uniref:Glutathione S-transferase n=1 Tax=Pseudomassariella vexata TaxID=1141098 RepID=A0A1Y2E7L2_9PEZI|nr:glutathione S-transferase [Pseudomassariella vexata]ORY67530.1 glutathione S-transferase [Pseudomassariella vexata]